MLECDVAFRHSNGSWGIGRKSHKQPLIDTRSTAALSAVCEFGHLSFFSRSEWPVRRAAPQHCDHELGVRFVPVTSIWQEGLLARLCSVAACLVRVL